MVLYATHVGEEFWCLCTSDGTELFSVLVVSQYVFLGLYKNTIRIWPKFSFRFHFPLVPENSPPIIYFTQVLFHQILSTGFLFVNWTSSPLLLLSSLWTWHHMQKIPMISVCLGCRRYFLSHGTFYDTAAGFFFAKNMSGVRLTGPKCCVYWWEWTSYVNRPKD